MKAIILRIIPVFAIINFLWGLIPIDTLPGIVQLILGDFLGPLVIVSLLISLSVYYLWKLPYIGVIIRWLFNLIIPLYGTWRGCIIYEHEGQQLKKDVFIVIKQINAFQLHILMYTDERESVSETAVISNHNGKKKLIYTYKIEDCIDNREINQPHTGTANLRIDESTSILNLNGDYYTTRKTVGKMQFKLLSRKLVDSYESALKLSPK